MHSASKRRINPRLINRQEAARAPGAAECTRAAACGTPPAIVYPPRHHAVTLDTAYRAGAGGGAN